MNKEIKMTIVDLFIGYGCAATLMCIVGGAAYSIGKSNGRSELGKEVERLIAKHFGN